MSSNLVWSIKNGDAENVREIFEKEVSEVAGIEFWKVIINSSSGHLETGRQSDDRRAATAALRRRLRPEGDHRVPDHEAGRRCQCKRFYFPFLGSIFYQKLSSNFFQALDKHNISPLLAAIWEGHTECVRLLIANGAQINGRTPDGLSYLEAAEKAEIKSMLSV